MNASNKFLPPETSSGPQAKQAAVDLCKQSASQRILKRTSSPNSADTDDEDTVTEPSGTCARRNLNWSNVKNDKEHGEGAEEADERVETAIGCHRSQSFDGLVDAGYGDLWR